MSNFNSHFGSKKLRNVKCSVCGKKFTTDHPCKKTCSIECSMIQKENYKKQLANDNQRYYSKAKKNKK